MANSNEKMKVGLSFNGKSVEVELTQEQLKELGLVEEKKKTGYERATPGGEYWWISGSDDAATVDWDNDMRSDDACYDLANYYSDQTVAENNSRADKLMRQLRRFAAENGGIPSKEDWENKHDSCNLSHAKHVVKYDHIDKRFEVGRWVCTQEPGVVYFKSKEACEEAIEEFKDELLWYFTEYQAMLY